MDTKISREKLPYEKTVRPFSYIAIFAEGVAVFKVLNPCVCETLPRETLAEGVAAKHAGNEETERGEDRADCVSEYCLLAWWGKVIYPNVVFLQIPTKIFEGVSGNGSNTSIINKLWPRGEQNE